MEIDKIKDIKVDLIEFQKNHDVSSLLYKDIEVWPVVLFEILNLTRKNKKKSNPFFVVLFTEFLFVFLRFFQSIIDNKKSSKKSECEVLFLTQSTRRVKLGNRYFDRIIDPFVLAFNKIGYKTNVLEWTYDKMYKIPRFYHSEFIQNKMGISLFLNMVLNRNKPICNLDLLDNENFVRIISKLNCSPADFNKKILSTSKNIDFLSVFFQKKMTPYLKLRYAYLYPYFGNVSFAFTLACKRINVQTIEIQHGYYGDNSFLYSGYCNLKKTSLLPNAVWCWENRDARVINNWGDSSLIPFTYVGGNLYSNFWSNSKNNDNSNLIENYEKKISKYSSKESNILVTLSPYDDIPQWFIDFMENQKEYRWFVRFHHHTPKDVKRLIIKRMSKVTAIEYTLSNELPLPMLLGFMNIHLTVFSSCVSEAKDFHVKSVIISELGVSIFKDFINNGWAYKALDYNELKVNIDFLLKEGKMTSNESYYSKSNSEIVLDFIDKFEKFNSEKSST